MAEAQQNMTFHGTDKKAVAYWQGARDTYHAMLNESFVGWASGKTTGYYVFYENMTYDEACAQVGRDVMAGMAQSEEGELFAI